MELLCGGSASVLKSVYVQREAETLNIKLLKSWDIASSLMEDIANDMDDTTCIHNIAEGIFLTSYSRKEGKGCVVVLNSGEYDESSKSSTLVDCTSRILPQFSSSEHAINSIQQMNDDKCVYALIGN